MTAEDQTRSIVARAKAGDRGAFDQLTVAFRDRLRASIETWRRFQLGPKTDPDDLLQETFLRAFRTIERFNWQDDDSFFKWLCGIAKHVLAEAAQDAWRAERQAQAQPGQRSDTSPTNVVRRQDRFDRLDAALKRLAPEHRQVILLCRIEGLTSAEAAERLNRSPAAVRQLLLRALRELKQNFGDTESFNLPDRRLMGPEAPDGE